MAAGYQAHWEKLLALIEKAKQDRELSERLKSGSPSDVAQILQEEVGLTMDDLGAVFTDLEFVADRGSLRYWSPLA